VTRVVVALLAVFGALAPAAAAAPPRFLVGGETIEGLAVAGGQGVYGVRGIRGGDQTLDVYVRSLAGGAARRVFHDRFTAFESPNADIDNLANETFAGSPRALAVAFSSAQETGVAASGSASLEFGAVGASRTVVEHCDDNDGEPSYDGAFLVAGTRVAYQSQCGASKGAVVVHDLSGGQRVFAPPPSAVAVIDALNGDQLAYETRAGSTATIHVVNLVTGATTDLPGPARVALQVDGKVAAAGPEADCPIPLRWYAPGSATATPLPGAHACDDLTFTGDRIFYRDANLTLHAIDLAGTDRSLFDVFQYAAEGNDGLALVGGCEQGALYAVALDGSTSAPHVPATCPVHVRSRHLRLRGRTVRASLSCPHGCGGELSLGRAHAPFSVIVPRTRGTVTLRLSRAAARRLGRRATLVITAKPGPVAPSRRTRVRVTISR
jgi:hypothetical protein